MGQSNGAVKWGSQMGQSNGAVKWGSQMMIMSDTRPEDDVHHSFGILFSLLESRPAFVSLWTIEMIESYLKFPSIAKSSRQVILRSNNSQIKQFSDQRNSEYQQYLQTFSLFPKVGKRKDRSIIFNSENSNEFNIHITFLLVDNLTDN
jgi:hypothetical protein